MGSLYWLGGSTLRGHVVLSALLAVAFMIWGGLIHGPLRRGGGRLLWVVPTAWIFTEFLRGNLFSGFGWNLLAHTQWRWPRLIQIADLAGAYGVSFLVMMVNTGIYLVWRRRVSRRTAAAAVGLCLLATLGYGTLRLGQVSGQLSAGEGSFRVAVLQGNIPQELKWAPACREAIWGRYERLTRQAARIRPDLIVWPETSVPTYLPDAQALARLQRLARSIGTPLLFGVPTRAAGEAHFNSAVLLGAQGDLIERHDKIHLVPYGEYTPLKPWLSWAGGLSPSQETVPGGRFTVFKSVPGTVSVPGTERRGGTIPPFGVLICFEDLFPDLYRRLVHSGARWLLVITNDAWFERSAASLQHLQASVFRAVEGRHWVARSANTGWTGFIDPAGRLSRFPAQLPRFESGWAWADLREVSIPTPYVHWGNWLVFLGVICLSAQRKLREGAVDRALRGKDRPE